MTIETEKTITLSVPVTFEGHDHNTITLRRLKAKDMRGFAKGSDTVSDTLKIIQTLSDWPPEGVDELDAIDLETIGEIITGFTTRHH